MNVKTELAKQAVRIIIHQMKKRQAQPTKHYVITTMPAPKTLYVTSERVR